MKEHKITFPEYNAEVFALPGTSLFECVTRAGILIKTPCAGAGTCGKCVVKVISGEVAPSEECKARFSDDELAEGNRLSCRTSVQGDLSIEIPVSSLFESGVVSLGGESSTSQPVTGESGKGGYGIAIDLGTTTIAMALMDLTSGRQIASAGALNPQVKFGDDVLNRICAQTESDENLKELSQCVVDSFNEMISELVEKQCVKNDDIKSVVIAGNTVMQHLLCGIPAKSLGEIPFDPVVSDTIHLTPKELPLNVSSDASITLFPVIGGYVGGDIVSGLLASEFTAEEKDSVSLFVDVGTNGEIVLRNGRVFYATAAAAGPAFEGAGIESGMRAANGAIEKILIEDGDIEFNVIGNQAPQGICGTALIDLVAEMLKNGLLDETGRILDADECENPSQTLKERLIPDDESGTIDFLIAENSEKKIFLRQKDIRQLQLASGAICASINILLKKAEITAHDINTLYLAGGFGNYIRRSHAKRIGMIPNIPGNNIHFIGNTSLIGAKVALLDNAKMEEAEKITEMVECVDVSLDLEFQMEFANAMIFPLL